MLCINYVVSTFVLGIPGARKYNENNAEIKMLAIHAQENMYCYLNLYALSKHIISITMQYNLIISLTDRINITEFNLLFWYFPQKAIYWNMPLRNYSMYGVYYSMYGVYFRVLCVV